MKIADLIVSMMPTSWRPYAKAVVALILSVGAIVATLAGAPVWVPVVLMILNAPVVYGVENEKVTSEDDYQPEHADL